MELTSNQIENILTTHNTLWDTLYDDTKQYSQLEYQGNIYDIFIQADRGYASTIIPNAKGIPFLWITQNLHKSTYGSYQIQEAKNKNQDLRITWIVDTRNNRFVYVSNIYTKYESSNLIYGKIEYYDSLGTGILWSSNPTEIPRKAKF